MKKNLAVLISPRIKSAYFNDSLKTAKAELAWALNIAELEIRTIGEMNFVDVSVEEGQVKKLATLSCVYGIFEKDGDALRPLKEDTPAPFSLHEDFVFGSKYKGKTSEIRTQMLIGVGLVAIDKPASKAKLLDPMCGRGTTLFWAMRFGMKAKGIEQDPAALSDIRQSIKKWTKIHRQKHQMNEGSIFPKAKKETTGKFLEFSAEKGAMRVITGDSINAAELLKGETFDLLVSDLPYGVHHHTTKQTRNPLAVLEACAKGWVETLKPGGALVLAFNSYIPKREELIELFEDHGLKALPFAAPHRVSESILRDVVVFRKA